MLYNVITKKGDTTMTILHNELKHSKKLFNPKNYPNNNDLEVHLFIMANPDYVGAIVVTKHVRDKYLGYLVRVTHEEYKLGALKNLSMSDIKK